MADMISGSDPECARHAARLLRQGSLVCYPTDTVYGIGALASEAAAVKRLFAVKGRQPDKALPVLIADTSQAPTLAEVSPLARALMQAFWPGGLTIVMPKRAGFRSAALAGGHTVALRVPDCDIVRDIIRLLGEPVTGTSANRSGSRAPLTAAEAAFQMGELVELVIDGGRTPGAIESTVVDLTEGAPRILREGAVSGEEIERAGGRKAR
jgi:L-threonylcarbamoyladenylate synthase